MVQGPPSSDSEDGDDPQQYQYESEGEEALGTSARTLFQEAGGNYRLARAALLAYTREDYIYLAPSTTTTTRTREPSRTIPPSPPATQRHQAMLSPPTVSSYSVMPPRVRTSHGAHPPTPRASLPTGSQPPANQLMNSRLITPTSTSRRPPTAQVTSNPPGSGTRLVDPPPFNNAVIEQPETSNEQSHPAVSSSSRLDKCLTIIYPLLLQTNMLGYFKIEDEVKRILNRIKRDQEWLGEYSHINTSAFRGVVPKNLLVIHRPTPDATSKAWYVVTAGIQVGIFTSWDTAAAYTQGVSCSVQRSWPTRMEAHRSLQLAVVLGTLRLLPDN